jgi:small-conductance mechanosensitive channel
MPDDASNILNFVRFGGLIPALIIVAVTWVAVKLIGRFVESLGDRFTERRLLIQQVATVVRFTAYFIGIASAVALCFQLTDQMLLALGGTIAVAFGFAMKDLAASLVGGLTILFDRPFQVGDRVTFEDHYGEITKIGLRSVRLVTLDDSVVTIPNNRFLTDAVVSGNAGALEMQVVIDFFVGVDQDVGLAKEIVRDAITSSRYTYLGKPWDVLVASVLQDSYCAVRLRAKVYVLDVQYEKALETDVTERVLGAFRENGIAPPAILHRTLPPLDVSRPDAAQPTADGRAA